MKRKFKVLLLLIFGSVNAFAQTITLTSGGGTDNQKLCNPTGITTITYNYGDAGEQATISPDLTTYGLTVNITYDGAAKTGTITISGGAGTPNTRTLINYIITVKPQGAGSDLTQNGSMEVYQVLTAGAAPADQEICYNTAPALLIATAPSGGDGNNSYQWQESTNNIDYTNVGTNSLSYQPEILTAKRYYRLNQTSAACGTVTTNVITIDVLPEYTAGTISSDQSICYNTTPAGLTGTAPSGGSGSFTYQWEENVSGTWNPATSTTLNFDPPQLTATTVYRLKQTDTGTGCVVTTNEVTVTVYPDFVSGTIGSDQTICYHTAAAELVGVAPTGGNTPYTYQWETNASGSWAPVPSLGNALNYQPPVLDATTSYRLVQTSASGCGAFTTNTVTITVRDEFLVGSISSGQTICYHTAPAELVGVAPTGGNTPYTYQWETNASGSWASVPSDGNGLNYQPPVLDATTSYRLVQTSASGCGTLTTNTVTITVRDQFVVGSISSGQTICYHTAPAELVGVAPTGGNTPYTYQWETNASGSWAPVPSLGNALNYQPPVLDATTSYRLVQTSASGCGAFTTNTVTITVRDEFLVGSISSGQTICYHTAPAELVGVAPTGGNTPYTYQWETNASGSWASVPSDGNGLNYQPPVLDATTSYRLVQTSASGCGALTTNTVTIVINELPVANNLTPTTVTCEDTFGGGSVANINLTVLNSSITGGAASRSVVWYRDIGSTPVPDDLNETVTNGEVFHPRVTNTLTSCYKDATVTYTVPPKVNISSVSLTGVPHQGAVLTIAYSTAGLCLPEVVESTEIEWYRNTTTSGTGTKFSTVSGDNKTYTLTSTDLGKYVRAGVKISDGTGILFSIVYSDWTTLPVSANVVPTVDPGTISITGTKQATQTLTAHYTYYDEEGDPESGSLYKWYKAYAAPGFTPAPGDYTEISGETGITHVINDSEQGYWFKFSVTPKAGTNNTAFGTMATVASGYGPVNKKPEITAISISGIEEVGQKLQGSYTYYDADNDPQGTCTFRWLRNGTPIAGATNDYYYVASGDLGSTLTFEATPVATQGYPLVGNASTVLTGTIQPLTTDFVNFKDKYCYGEGPTQISVKNVPISAVFEQFRCTNPDARLEIVNFNPLTVKVYPSEMTPVRPVGTKTDYLIYSYIDLRSGLTFEISKAFVIDSISTKLAIGGLKDEYCIDAAPEAITIDALFPFGGTGEWTDPAGLLSDKVVTGPAQGATVNPSRAPAGTYPITYKYTSALGCIRELTPRNVIINALPDPEFYVSDTINVDGGPVTLVPKTGGGIFSGTGVTGNRFLPDEAGTGNYILTHSITDGNGCFNSTFITATVKRAEGTISGIAPKICYEDRTYTVNVSGLPAKAVPTRFTNKNTTIVYTPGSTTASYNIVAAGPGDDIVKFYYMYGGVEFWLTAPVFVDKLEPAEIRNLAAGEKICQNKTEYELFPSVAGGTFTGPMIGNYLYPSRALGATEVSYRYTNASTGCSATTIVPIYIVKPPQVAFVPEDICIDSSTDSTRFINNTTSEDPVDNWQWIFSEIGAAPDSRKNTAFLYRTGGLHTVSLTARTQIGCTVTATSTIDLGIKPSASFYWKNDCYSPGGTVRLYDASQSASAITRRTWNFNDGELITSDLNPVYTMRDTGFVKVSYEVGISYAGCSDTEVRYMYLRPTYSISADGFYAQNFESGSSGWVKDDSVALNNWTFGKPGRTVINKAASGTKAWYTAYNMINPVREQSSVMSPCFDFRGISKPMISLKTFKRFERNRNGVALQYKFDGSNKWNYVGTVGDGIGWYNSSVISGSPGGEKIGWTTLNNDPDTAWTESRHKLDELSGKTNIKFRIVYGSDDVPAPEEGFAFDDVWIGERTHKVLMEHFTNIGSRDASTANTVVNNAVTKAKKDVINIQYHTNFPGSDPLYDFNPGDVSARILSYGLTRVPFTLIDGGNNPESWAKSIDFRSSLIDTSDIARRSMTDPYFSIQVSSYVADGVLDVNCRIKALTTVTSRNLVLYLAVTEKKNDDYTGAAGETSFYNVFRKFLPDAGGILLKKSWIAGEEWIVPEQSWLIEKIKNSKDIEVIAFIQNDQTKEVFQAASQLNNTSVVGIRDNGLPNLEFSVYPNPASDQITVGFGEAVKTKAEISILNVQGQVVRRYTAGSGTTEYTIENPGLKGGIYMIKVFMGGIETGFKKLVITED